MKNFYEIIENIIISLLVITIIILFSFRTVLVDGSSMLPTLHDHERLIITNLFYNVEKGDIVVVDKNNAYKEPLIKRVIATEGDKIKIEYSTGNVYVNDKLLNEDYIYEKINIQNIPDLEVTVAKDCVFVMGDNRNNSGDSRDSSIGLINKKNLLGKAVLRIYPFDNIGVLQ